jgi:signal transduction histidine kinase
MKHTRSTPPDISLHAAGAVADEAAPADHDLARVLAGFDRNLDRLADDWLSPESGAAVESLRALTAYLRRLSRAMCTAVADLDARAESLGMDLATWWPDMRLLLHAIHGDEVIVRADIPPDLPGVRIRPDRLTHVILGLVTYAGHEPPLACVADHAEGPGEHAPGEVEFSARRADRITDKSVNADPPSLSRRREPFFRASGDGTGTGTGVPWVRRLIADAGGRVQFSSAAGSGETAAITLPIITENGAARGRALAAL